MPQITEKHKEFARAVVALAREHGANHLNVEFDFCSSKLFATDDETRHQKMNFIWQEGRHGASERITVNASEMVYMREHISTEKGESA